MQAPKLIIWDLDGTLWRGTLSEGGAEAIDANLELVRALARRGIPSAIASKNDRQEAMAQLARWQMQDWFVLCRIAWQPKGPAVRWIIEQSRLRAEDVLFIDDEPSNRAEVEHANPGVRTAGPQILEAIDPSAWGKDDKDLTRLAQFRILERRADDAGETEMNNEAFLRSAEIEVRYGDRAACQDQLVRVHELVMRTNRLNFTRVRLTQDGLHSLVNDARCEPGAVWVRDRWGDYGLVGFWAVVSGRLSHFLFSCRVLDMGVEQHVLHALRARHPELTWSFELEARARDWIREGSTPTAPQRATASSLQVAFKGACDLDAFMPYFSQRYRTQQELQIPLPDGRSDLFSSHTDMALHHRWRGEFTELSFVGPQSFGSALLDGEWDLLVYGLSMDYSAGRYRSRSSGAVLAAGWFFADLFADADRPFARWENETDGYIDSNRRRLTEDFEHVGGISADELSANLDRIAENADGRPVVLINVVDHGDATCPEGEVLNPIFVARNAGLNSAVDEAVARHPNLELIDMRTIVQPHEVMDMHAHVRRRCLAVAARRLDAIIEGHARSQRLAAAFATVGRRR